MLEKLGYFDPEALPAPVSTTGLDLQGLYGQHVGNEHRDRRSEGRFLHLIVQFPTQLVDGEDPEWMLFQARKFSEAVFGDRAIFADRVDRHESGRHTVDIFVAPLVEKRTKRTTKLALSLTKGMDELCNSLGIKPSRRGPQGLLRAYGRALQTAWFNHLVAAGVEGVVRGEEKEGIDPDRVSPEVYKVRKERELGQQELEAWAAYERQELELEKAKVDEQRAANERVAAQLEADRREWRRRLDEVEFERDGARHVGQQAVADWEAAISAKHQAETLQASLEAKLASANADAAQAKLDRNAAALVKKDAETLQASMKAMLASANADAVQAKLDRNAAAFAKKDAELAMASAMQELTKVT
jgi:hypothetical protein